MIIISFCDKLSKKMFFYVNLAWEEVTGPCTCAEPSRTAFPNGVRTENIFIDDIENTKIPSKLEVAPPLSKMLTG